MMDRIIEALEPLVEGDGFLAAPQFQTRLLLRNKLLAPLEEALESIYPVSCKEKAHALACSITARMNVEVNDTFIEHPRRDELLDIFAKLIVKTFTALKHEGYSTKDFEAIMSQIDIKYNF